MKACKNLIITISLVYSCVAFSQYTEVINSNRPGVSISPFSLGTGVLQGEFGIAFERQEHDLLLTENFDYGIDFAIRYGLFLEQLEVFWEGSYIFRNATLNSVSPPIEENLNNFTRHVVGAKYLIYDPYKKAKDAAPNLYSWKANNSFKWRDLIPAISIFAGINIVIPDNPFFFTDDVISPKIGIAAQSHIGARWVVVGNIIYDQITTVDPALSYVITVTHNLRNPKWSVFLENVGIDSDFFADVSLRGGAARLIHKNFQVDASIGTNFKNTPSRIFGTFGISYRIDNHKDKLINNEEKPRKLKGSYKKLKKQQKKDQDKSDDSSLF